VVAHAGGAANHRKVRRSRAVVLSVAETAQGMRQVWVKKASGSEPLMTCRKLLDGIETGIVGVSRDEPGGCLRAAQEVSGMEAARSWPGLLRGTCEPVASARWSACGWPWEGEPQAVEAARGGVPSRWGTGADRLVVAMTPGNAGRAKGAGHPGLLGGQPVLPGEAR
jgi:hypothetical protein